MKQHKKGKRKKKVGNNDKGFLFLNKKMAKNNRGGRSYTLDLEFRWETGRHNLGKGDKMGNLGEH